jgi:hypothetical protein
MRHTRGAAALALRVSLVVLLSFTAASAQSVSTAQINGAIRDEGGLALPGVTVNVTQTDTGLTRSVVTDETGSYILQNLPIGPYRLEAALQGFRTYVQTGIVLQVNANPTLNVTLQLGQLEETITVEASAALVETRNPGIGQVVTNEQVVELPLNGRQLTQLILTAGMATSGAGPGNALATPRSYPTITITVAGGLANGMTYILDGGNHNDPYNNLNLPLPFPDAMQEFKVETSALPAQYGHHAAAAVNAVTKSGTNVVHGSGFAFMRDSSLNAKNAFAAIGPDGKRKDDGLRRDQFGGTLGGPIVSGKLFYFGGYQGTRVDVTPSTFFSFVPTAQMLAGDFSTITSPACNAGRTIALRAPFVNNRVDPALFSRVALNVTSRLPKTTDPCGRVDYARKQHSFENIGIGRIDYQLSDDHTLFGRYQLADYRTEADYDPDNILAYSASPQYDTVNSLVLGDTYLLGSNAVSSFRLTVNTADIRKPWIPFFDAQEMGVRNIANMMPGHMRVGVSGGFTIGGSGPGSSNTPTRSFQLVEDLSFVRGAHQIGVGGSFVRQGIDAESYVNAAGNFTFTGAITGLGFGDFLLGRPNTLQQGMVYRLYDRSTYFGSYIQDAWRASSRLTINAGLRWEPYLPFTEELGQFSHFDLEQWGSGVRSTVYKNAPKGVIFSGDPGYPGKAAGEKQLANFAPRVSAAWDVRGDGRMTMRSAWGRFYDLPHLYMFLGFAVAPPLGSVVTVNGASFEDPYANVVGGNPFPLTANPNMTFPQFANWLTFPLDMKPWYSDQWNVSLQRQLGASWAVSANYVNARGHNLPVGDNLNPAVYGPGATVANTNQRRKLSLEDPQQGQYYGLVIAVKPIGTSAYDALLLSVQRRAARGLTISSNYTLSTCTTDLVNYEPAMAGRPLVKPGDLAYDRGSCGPSDRRHVANLSTVYQLPELASGGLGLLANDWQVSAIVRAQSGNFFEVTTGVDNALNGQGNQRPNQIMSDPYLKDGYQWLNPAAFQAPAPGEFGNTPIHAYEGPGTFNVDMGLTRSFRIGGERQIQLRAEVFNLLNNVQLNNPVSSLNNSNFGIITSANDPRIVQLALKYVF